MVNLELKQWQGCQDVKAVSVNRGWNLIFDRFVFFTTELLKLDVLCNFSVQERMCVPEENCYDQHNSILHHKEMHGLFLTYFWGLLLVCFRGTFSGLCSNAENICLQMLCVQFDWILAIFQRKIGIFPNLLKAGKDLSKNTLKLSLQSILSATCRYKRRNFQMIICKDFHFTNKYYFVLNSHKIPTKDDEVCDCNLTKCEKFKEYEYFWKPSFWSFHPGGQLIDPSQPF